MIRLVAIFIVFALTCNLASAGWLKNYRESKETNYTKRNEMYLRDVKKRDAKRRYNKKLEDRLPSGKMTVEQYQNLSRHKNPESDNELKPIEIPTIPIPSEMKYAPQPTYSFVRYNDPPGSPELSLKKNFYKEKQQNAQGIISPDYSMLVYPAIYYSPDSASTSAELFAIPLDTKETELDRVLKAHTSNRMQKPLLATNKTIDNWATFRTLTPVDFSEDGKKILVKAKTGNSLDGIWETDVWIYDFVTGEAKELAEIRDAITHHWTTYRGLPLYDKRWDIVPLGFSQEEPDRIICTAYAYTGEKPVFLGVWSIDIEREQSRLVSFENIDIPISVNGLKIVKTGVKPYILVQEEEEIMKEQDKKNKEAQKKAKENFEKQCKKEYEAELKRIDEECARNIKEYEKLQRYTGSTSYNEGYEKYRNVRIKELEKTIQKEEKNIEKLEKQINALQEKIDGASETSDEDVQK